MVVSNSLIEFQHVFHLFRQVLLELADRVGDARSHGLTKQQINQLAWYQFGSKHHGSKQQDDDADCNNNPPNSS